MEERVLESFLNYFKGDPEGICWFETSENIELARQLAKMGYVSEVGHELDSVAFQLINSSPPKESPKPVSSPSIVPIVEANEEIIHTLILLKTSTKNMMENIDKLLKEINS